MKLRYHHVTIKMRCQEMPYRYWRYLLKNLKIVYAAFGIKREGPNEPHVLYMLYEDDAYLRGYARYLERSKPRIKVYHEEHDMSEDVLMNVRSTYGKISPKMFQIDNIDDYLP